MTRVIKPVNQVRGVGFSLIELVVVISLVSIISVFAIPRLNTNTFREAGFVQQSAAAIRYGQKQALSTGCAVNVSITAGSCTLKWSNPGADPACPVNGTNILNPGTGSTDFCASSTPETTSDLPAVFTFDRIGRPDTAQSITLGSRTIRVEAETGFTHEL